MKSDSSKKKHSADFARERMNLLLVAERLECSTGYALMMKKDLIHTIKRYTSADEEQAVLSIHDDPPVLRFEIPLSRENDRGK